MPPRRPAPAPFRTQCHVTPDGDAALARLATNAPEQRMEIATWLAHPDERVVLAYLDRESVLARGTSDGREALVARVEATLAAEPDLWSPILDRAYQDGAAGDLRHVLPAFERAFARWARAQQAPEALTTLAPFSSEFPYLAVAGALRGWTPAAVQQLLTRAPRAAARLARNPAVAEPAVVDTLARWALRAFDNALTPDYHTYQRAAHALMALFSRGLAVTHEVADALVACLDNPNWYGAYFAAQAFGAFPVHDGRRLERARMLLWEKDAKLLGNVVKSPTVPLEFVRRVLRDKPRLPVRRSLLGRVDALQDPETRAMLGQGSNCARVLRALVSTSTSNAELSGYLGRLTRQNAYRAIETIEEALPDGLGFAPDALAPLFDPAQSQDTRLRALEALERAVASEAVSESPVAERSEPPERPSATDAASGARRR